MNSMDSQKIATWGILSLTTPSVVRWNRRERREMPHRVNEYTTHLHAKRTDRFGIFATLPFPTLPTLCKKVIQGYVQISRRNCRGIRGSIRNR
jgi:hypothetical protein